MNDDGRFGPRDRVVCPLCGRATRAFIDKQGRRVYAKHPPAHNPPCENTHRPVDR